MKKMFNFLIFVFLSVFFVFPNQVLAYDSNDYDYVLEKYDIDIVVNENNTLKITETIDAKFNVLKHGIYRKIPLNNTVKRLDGTTSKVKAQISQINVNEQYSLSQSSGYKIIKIGNPNYSFRGSKQYVISYLYNLGKDKSEDYDELYFNLIGSEWDTVIDGITFTITMPKEFDEEKLGFSSGKVGSTDSSKVNYEVAGNIITGFVSEELKPGEALTVRLELPDGYFVGAGYQYNHAILFFLFVLPISFVIISLGIWFIFGKDDSVVETVEFYPPEGMNSAEVAFLYNGKVTNQDVVSLLIYLANKGYIKITEVEEQLLFKTIKSLKVSKLKEYDGNDVNERIFFQGLFHPNLYRKFRPFVPNTNDCSVTEVTISSLRMSFYQVIDNITKNLNAKENRNKIITKSSSRAKFFPICLMLLTYLIINFVALWNVQMLELLFVALLFPGIGFGVMYSILSSKQATAFSKIFVIFWGTFFGGIPFTMLVLPALLSDSIYLIGYISGIICILIMSRIVKYMPRRTAYGNEILGKIKGFKNFLETAEKPKLESMVMQNPTYFYDILPYTYVLGVSDKWIEKFEVIAVEPPTWYDSTEPFTVATFGSFMTSTLKTANNYMSSRPSSSGSSSGGSSGGGSSGGGSGGGGGGSW